MGVYKFALILFDLQTHDWSIEKNKLLWPEYRLTVASC